MTPRVPDAAELADDLRDLRADLRDLKSGMSSTYLPRELFEARLDSFRKDIDALAQAVAAIASDVKDLKERGETNRRLFLSGLALPLLMMMIGGMLAAGMVQL